MSVFNQILSLLGIVCFLGQENTKWLKNTRCHLPFGGISLSPVGSTLSERGPLNLNYGRLSLIRQGTQESEHCVVGSSISTRKMVYQTFRLFPRDVTLSSSLLSAYLSLHSSLPRSRRSGPRRDKGVGPSPSSRECIKKERKVSIKLKQKKTNVSFEEW